MDRTVSVLWLFAILLFMMQGCGEDEEEFDNDGGGGVVDNAKIINIALPGSLQNPAFSPDGSAIVFTQFKNGYNEPPASLYIYTFSSGNLKKLVDNEFSNVNLPGESWKGSKIVFSSERDPHDEIFMIDQAGNSGDEVKVTAQNDKQSYEPTFSPDAEWIVFESHPVDVEGQGVITKYKVNGTAGYVTLTSSDDDCRQPNWSPAGDRILYQRNSGGVWAIWVMNSDGSNKIRVTPESESATDAAFLSDGTKIIYSSENENVNLSQLSIINIQTKEIVRVTNSSRYDGAPSISPDGKRVVFESTPGDPDESSGSKLWMVEI